MTNAMTKTAALLALAFSLTASAAPQKSAPEIWAGQGSVFTPAGQKLSDYKIQVTVTPDSAHPGTVEASAKITRPDGSTNVIDEKITVSGNGFQISSSLGNGGGSCYGDDFCESYIAGQNGQAYATTIVQESQSARRDLTVVLKDGVAVKMLSESLTRVN